MPLEREIKPEDLEFKGYVVAPNADIAAARAYKIWGSGVYVVDSIRNIPVLYGVYDAEWNHVGVVLARSAAEARAEAEKKFGAPPAPMTAWNVDRISTGERIYAVYLIKGLEAPEITRPPTTTPPVEEVPPEEEVTPTPPPEEEVTPTPPPPPQKATVQVTSNPSGAHIFVNGEDTGKTTPTTLELDPGAYTITLKLEGYEEWGTSIRLEAGTNPPIEATLTKIIPPAPKFRILDVMGGYSPPNVLVRVTVENYSEVPGTVEVKCIIINQRTARNMGDIKRVSLNPEQHKFLLFTFTDYTAQRGDRVEYRVYLDNKLTKSGFFTL